MLETRLTKKFSGKLFGGNSRVEFHVFFLPILLLIPIVRVFSFLAEGKNFRQLDNEVKVSVEINLR